MSYKSGAAGDDDKPTAKQPKEYFVPQHPDVQQQKKEPTFFDPMTPIPTGGSIGTVPVVHDDTVFFGSFTKHLFAINAKTGKLKWKFLTGDVIFSCPVIFKDLVIFGSFDGFVYAVEKETGRLRWKFRTNNRIWGALIAIEDIVYVGSTDAYFYAIDAETGRLIWKFYAQKPITTEAVAVNDMIIFGTYRGRIFSLDYKTGRLIWSFRPFKAEYPSIIVSDGYNCVSSFHTSRSACNMPKTKEGTVYFTGADKNIYALDFDGREKWRFLADNIPMYCNFHKGVLYFGCLDNCMYAVHEGQLYWKIRTGHWVMSDVVVHDDILYFTSMDQCVYAATLDGKVLWKLMTSGILFSPPAIHGDVLYFGSDDTHLYALNVKTREILWRFHTGVPLKVLDTKEGKEIIQQVVDFSRRIFTVWTPETTKTEIQSFVHKTYKATSQMLTEMPETIYGTANPYRGKTTGYETGKTYGSEKKKDKMPWEM